MRRSSDERLSNTSRWHSSGGSWASERWCTPWAPTSISGNASHKGSALAADSELDPFRTAVGPEKGLFERIPPEAPRDAGRSGAEKESRRDTKLRQDRRCALEVVHVPVVEGQRNAALRRLPARSRRGERSEWEDVSGLANFCTIEPSPLPGFEFLIRFRGAAAANIIVTIRTSEVEQAFCSHGGQIAFADLTASAPVFVVVSPQEVESLNALVAQMIR